MTFEKEGKVLNHVVIDIETLGVTPGSYITTISANVLGSEEVLNISNIIYGKELSPTLEYDTVKWWLTKAPKEAQEFLFEGDPVDIGEALDCLSLYLKENSPFVLWGNSPDFDMGHLGYWYSKLGKEIPWKYYQLRDIRTIKSFLDEETVKAIDAKYTKHISAEDVLIEGEYLKSFLDLLDKSKNL